MKHQNGFTLIEGLLIAVVLSVIGFGGYYVWNEQNKKPTTASNQSSSNNNQNVAQKTYLEIPELGVKVSMSKDIPDMYYSIKTRSNDGNKYAVLSSRSLAALEPECAAERTSASGVQGSGAVYVYTDPNAPDPFAGTITMKEEFPESVEVSGKYYTLVPNVQGVCYDDNKYQGVYDTDEVTQKNKALTVFLRDTAVLEKL